MVMDDRRVKMREIASAVGVSNERVLNVLQKSHAQDGCRDCSRLTENEIVCGVAWTVCSCCPQDCKRRYVTVDET